MSAPQARETAPLAGRHVYLRELRVADIDSGYLEWINDAAATRFLESRFRQWTREDLVAFVENDLASDKAFAMAICRMEDGAHIGNIRLSKLDRRHGNASVGILIGNAGHRGKGYGSEAIGLMCRFAFDQLGLHRLTAGFYANNTASIAAFLRAGFVEEGRMTGRWIDRGERVDGVICGITRERWRGGRGNTATEEKGNSR